MQRLLKNNPLAEYPSYEKLSFDLEGMFSRRVNIQHRIVYQIFPEENTVKVLHMWTHYDK